MRRASRLPPSPLPRPISLPARNTLPVCRTLRASVAQRKTRAGAAPILHATRGRVSGVESARETARAPTSWPSHAP